MDSKDRPRSSDRRSFLKGAGIAGGAAGVAAVALTAKPTKAAMPDTGKGAGYRQTEHVAKYYALARF